MVTPVRNNFTQARRNENGDVVAYFITICYGYWRGRGYARELKTKRQIKKKNKKSNETRP